MNPNPQAAATTQQHAYRYLREKILSGAFKGGEHVNPAIVAEELGISRMPVREAIRQLDTEGLVTIRPNRGAIVTILTAADVQELFEMRAVLEALAIRLAMPNLEGETFDDLVHLRDRMERVRGDTKQWIERHDAFHDHICRLSNRPRLAAEIGRLRAAVQPYLQMYISVHDGPEIEGYEHDALVDSIRSRNPSLAEICMRDHVLSAARGVIEFLESAATQARDGPRPGTRAQRRASI